MSLLPGPSSSGMPSLDFPDPVPIPLYIKQKERKEKNQHISLFVTKILESLQPRTTPIENDSMRERDKEKALPPVDSLCKGPQSQCWAKTKQVAGATPGLLCVWQGTKLLSYFPGCT